MMIGETATHEEAGQKTVGKAERREARLKRHAAKAEKAVKNDRPLHLCSLATVDVKKSAEGYQLGLTSAGLRRTVNVAPSDVGQVLRDLETAIQVIRSQE